LSFDQEGVLEKLGGRPAVLLVATGHLVQQVAEGRREGGRHVKGRVALGRLAAGQQRQRGAQVEDVHLLARLARAVEVGPQRRLAGVRGGRGAAVRAKVVGEVAQPATRGEVGEGEEAVVAVQDAGQVDVAVEHAARVQEVQRGQHVAAQRLQVAGAGGRAAPKQLGHRHAARHVHFGNVEHARARRLPDRHRQVAHQVRVLDLDQALELALQRLDLSNEPFLHHHVGVPRQTHLFVQKSRIGALFQPVQTPFRYADHLIRSLDKTVVTMIKTVRLTCKESGCHILNAMQVG